MKKTAPRINSIVNLSCRITAHISCSTYQKMMNGDGNTTPVKTIFERD